MSEKKQRANHDSAWKDILDVYFKEFMEFFYPVIAKKIDWSTNYEALDKELQTITTTATIGKRFVDKLFKVKTLEGHEEVILIHVEIQGKKEEEFSLRLFQYYYRLFEKHGHSILTLAILTDGNTNWHPKNYQKQVLGLSILNFNFQTNKLLDYRKNKQELETTINPFGIVVLVQLAAIETKGNPQGRYEMKNKITRLLLKKGYKKDYILNLFKVIDWGLVLPPDLKFQYNNDIEQLKGEEGMSYVLSAVREEIEKNHQSWLQQGLQQGIEQGEQSKALAIATIARNLLKQKVALSTIKTATGLSERELLELEDA
ncbi:MAG: hypothetical protein E6K54_07360 [Gammaproteobacteria bacterium]|nr:MAG: hypothetical protein E6K54_07360 [Gammaproteobacteria bacterium]